jgi:arylsulfatase A-like enzyme
LDRRKMLSLVGASGAALVASRSTRTLATQGTNSRPNIILIVIDDLRWDEFGAAGHPYLKTPHIDRLAREGASFSNAFHATPLCSPNRACILMGQHTARHGVYNNASRDALSHLLKTFPQELQRAGYRTAHVGKWHMGNDPSPRPGFDYWVSFPGQGRILNPELYENGRLNKVQGYVTDLLTDRSLKFLRDQRDSSRPFFLYLAHKAVHPDSIQRNDGSVDNDYGARYIPADRHKDKYKNEIFPRSQIKKSAVEGALGSVMVHKFLERKASPEIVKEFGSRLDPGTSEQSIRERAEMILSIDEGLGNILAELEESGTLENTMIVFTSDNGYFFGEHGLSLERRLPYEEAIRSPLLVRYPAMIRPGTSVDSLVSMIDIAPSILQFGQANISSHVQGISFAPLLASGYGKKGRRTSVLIENFSDDLPYPWVLDADYKAIRNEDYKYIHWNMNPEYDELYDLQSDPQEQVNILNTSVGRKLSTKLRTELAQLVRDSISL